MYPHERSLVKMYRDRPFALIGVNSDPDRRILRKIMKNESITWRSFVDGSTQGPIATRWNITGWPTLFLLDAKGVIRYRNLRGESLDKAIASLVKEAESSASPKKQ